MDKLLFFQKADGQNGFRLFPPISLLKLTSHQMKYGTVWYGMVWYCDVWYGMAGYGMAWCGMALTGWWLGRWCWQGPAPCPAPRRGAANKLAPPPHMAP